MLDATILVSAAKSVLEQGVTVVRKGGEPPTGEVANVSETLLDLRVPEILEAALAPALQEIGFELHHSNAVERYGTATRQFTVAERDPDRRYLIHVPRSILENYASAHRDALAAVPYAFQPSSIVCIFSQACQAVEFSLRELIQTGWNDQRVSGTFIPWRDVDDLKAASSPKKRKMIQDMLRLQNGSQSPLPAPASSGAIAAPVVRLGPADMQAVVRIVSEVPSFQKENERKILIELAGLNEICASVDYSSSPYIVAGAVVRAK